MTFDNQRNVVNISQRMLLSIIIFLLVIIGSLAGMQGWLRQLDVYWEMPFATEVFWASLAAFVGVMAYYNLADHHYFYYSDDTPGKLVFRFYRIGISKTKYKSIEIAQNDLLRFEMEKKNFGAKKQITLYARFNNQLAKYPPISVSALNEEQEEMLRRSLTHYAKK
jgi:hypothetical protein